MGYENEEKKGASHFQWLADHLHVGVKDMVMVGDSLDDYRVSHAAHVDFVAMLGSMAADDFHQLNPSIICIKNIPTLLTL